MLLDRPDLGDTPRESDQKSSDSTVSLLPESRPDRRWCTWFHQMVSPPIPFFVGRSETLFGRGPPLLLSLRVWTDRAPIEADRPVSAEAWSCRRGPDGPD